MWTIFRLIFNLQISYTRCVGGLSGDLVGGEGTRSRRFNSGYRDPGLLQVDFSLVDYVHMSSGLHMYMYIIMCIHVYMCTLCTHTKWATCVHVHNYVCTCVHVHIMYTCQVGYMCT